MISIVRDYEKWGEVIMAPQELTTATFKEIDAVDSLLIEFSEKGVGVGVEIGYAL